MPVLGFVIKWLDKTFNERNLEITENPENGYRLSIRERSGLDHSSSSISGLSAGQTTNLFNITIGSESSLSGVNIKGNCEADVRVFVNGEQIYIRTIDKSEQSHFDIFPAQKYLSAGDVVLVTLFNCGENSGDYESTLYFNT